MRLLSCTQPIGETARVSLSPSIAKSLSYGVMSVCGFVVIHVRLCVEKLKHAIFAYVDLFLNRRNGALILLSREELLVPLTFIDAAGMERMIKPKKSSVEFEVFSG
jgi:hypothetical protein